MILDYIGITVNKESAILHYIQVYYLTLEPKNIQEYHTGNLLLL